MFKGPVIHKALMSDYVNIEVEETEFIHIAASCTLVTIVIMVQLATAMMETIHLRIIVAKIVNLYLVS
jgi:hypothetical protein